jgi:DNA-binding MarR family transcriptional regulator/N-acetylglutamate synthase-like GNAT family acetyltransferase
MDREASEDQISAVRHFNRFFTRQIGVLREGLLHSPYPLIDARILFELGQRDQLTATHLCRELGLDAGYASRVLTRLEQQGLLEKVRSAGDGRSFILHLTEKGQEAFVLLDQRSRTEAGELLNDLSAVDQQKLLRAMQTIEGILTRGLKFADPFILRTHQPGDMGKVTQLHGQLYAQEYGFDTSFEALVAQIVADFITNFKPDRERCWIAEMNGEVVGSVFVVQKDEQVAKLRLLLVDPKARGLGLGSRLVDECIRFAQRCGYKKLILWTNSILLEARNIYQKAGFKLIEEEAHHSYGQDLIGETWELDLKKDF